jgi:hypothetical protein
MVMIHMGIAVEVEPKRMSQEGGLIGIVVRQR